MLDFLSSLKRKKRKKVYLPSRLGDFLVSSRKSCTNSFLFFCRILFGKKMREKKRMRSMSLFFLQVALQLVIHQLTKTIFFVQTISVLVVFFLTNYDDNNNDGWPVRQSDHQLTNHSFHNGEVKSMPIARNFFFFTIRASMNKPNGPPTKAFFLLYHQLDILLWLRKFLFFLRN